MGQHKNPHLLL